MPCCSIESWSKIGRYYKHGIEVRAGATILDVGANVGLFAITAARAAPDLRILCFEPVPLLFEALQRNLAAHAPTAVAHRVALARTGGTASIAFNPFSTVTGSLCPDAVHQASDRDASLMAWAIAGLADLERVRPSMLTRASRAGLAHPATAWPTLAALLPLIAFVELRARLFTRRQPCELRRLSDVLRAYGRPEVELVKVDVEGAEEDALGGIDEDDWPLLRQLVIEVHDVDGRLDRMTAQLQSRGYRTVRDREPWALHVMMNISTLYAIRR